MQLIHAVGMDAERYVAENVERQIRAPVHCPHCSRIRALSALGYYSRNLSRFGTGMLRIFVRRFRCRSCGKTVSILPAFAQPYRLVQNSTIESYVRGSPFPEEVIRYTDLLSQYWKSFSRWLPEVERSIGTVFERAPPTPPEEGWRFLLAKYNGLGGATQTLVSDFQITLFGRYRCHQPNSERTSMS